MKNKPKPEDLDEVILESGIKVKPIFGPEDIKDIPFEYNYEQITRNICKIEGVQFTKAGDVLVFISVSV